MPRIKTKPSQLVGGEGAFAGHFITLPTARTKVMQDVYWGRHERLFTPAYWAAQAWHHSIEVGSGPMRLGKTLTEEVAACILGGYGMPAEVGIAAFQTVRDSGLLNKGNPSSQQLEEVLSCPLQFGARSVRYRFPRQKAEYLSEAIAALRNMTLPMGEHNCFRDKLAEIRGIGLKTASWITRNWLDSDQVAVLDVHVVRAGQLIRLFPKVVNLTREYRRLEAVFLEFARRIGVRASRLDALMWRQMKAAGHLALRVHADRAA